MRNGQREPPFDEALTDVLRSDPYSLLSKRKGIHLLSFWKSLLQRQDKLPFPTQFMTRNQEKYNKIVKFT
jgi:hypothetical protein